VLGAKVIPPCKVVTISIFEQRRDIKYFQAKYYGEMITPHQLANIDYDIKEILHVNYAEQQNTQVRQEALEWLRELRFECELILDAANREAIGQRELRERTKDSMAVQRAHFKSQQFLREYNMGWHSKRKSK
jgi:hypothetical protein